MSKVIAWLKDNVWAVVVALVAALGAGIFWAYHRGKIRSLEAQRAIEKAHREVARIDGQITELEVRKEENRVHIEELQAARKEVQRRTVELEEDVKGMSDEEVERAFQNLY